MNLPLLDIEAEAPRRAAPHVFVRALTTPPGAPWEQARAARLEAEHGAPLPISELMHQVKRVDAWAPGRAGRFGVFYLRRQEYSGPFETTVEVDGQPVKVAFGTSAGQVQRLQLAGLVFGLFLLAGLVVGAGLMLAMRARSEAAVRLEAAEQIAASRLRAGEAFRRRTNQTRELEAAVAQARPLGEVINELTWVATSKAPEARIVGVHWERGLLAVEARGETPPFMAVDRTIERVEKPLRPGVWLWAVGSPNPAARGPVAAEVGP